MQLTDLQLLTAALAIIIPISSLIYSNSRVTDTRVALAKSIDESKETLRAEMQAMKTELSAEIRAIKLEINAEIQAGFERVENALKIHVLEHHS